MSPKIIPSPKKNYTTVPREFHQLITDRIVDISGATKFYKQRAHLSTLVEALVNALPNSRYALEERFCSYFVISLVPFSDSVKFLGAPNALAEALYRLARHWANIDFGHLPIQPFPSDEFFRDQWKNASDWEAFVTHGGTTAETWLLCVGKDGAVESWSEGSKEQGFSMTLAFSGDRKSAPSVTIRLTGEAATVIMNRWMSLNMNGAEESSEKAKILLNTLLADLKVKLKLVNPQKGRPRDDFGQQAAYLLDHRGLKIQKVAQKLLLPTDSPNDRKKTYDRIRAAVKNYYKVLRDNYIRGNVI